MKAPIPCGKARTPKPESHITIGVIWVVVKIMVIFGVPSIIRHLIFRAPKKGPEF